MWINISCVFLLSLFCSVNKVLLTFVYSVYHMCWQQVGLQERVQHTYFLLSFLKYSPTNCSQVFSEIKISDKLTLLYRLLSARKTKLQCATHRYMTFQTINVLSHQQSLWIFILSKNVAPNKTSLFQTIGKLQQEPLWLTSYMYK